MKLPDIGLIGYAGAGKDTAAHVLIQEFGYTRKAFATPLKELALLLGWDGVKNERGRALLQDLGMAGRQYDSQLWIKRLAQTPQPDGPIVYTDVRFRNEAAYVRSRGGIIIEICRKEATPETQVHISESEHRLIRPDYAAFNNGTIRALHDRLRQIVYWAAIV